MFILYVEKPVPKDIDKKSKHEKMMVYWNKYEKCIKELFEELSWAKL